MKYILPIFIFFCSCSTSKKIKSVTKTTIDSVSVKTVDSVSVKKDNTITTVEKEDNYEKETVIEFDTTNHFPKAGDMVADYFTPVKKITIKEKGVKKEKVIVAANTVDSTQFANHESTQLKKTETVRNKEVKRTSYWGWLWLLLLIPAYIIYRNWKKIKLFI